jgi:transcriptional regulator with XRE-family HTH domain
MSSKRLGAAPSLRRSAVDQQLGVRIREFREARDITQAELGALMGVSFQQVQKYEKGESSVAASRLPALCAALGVYINDLFPEYSALKLSSIALGLAKLFDEITDTRLRRIIIGVTELAGGENGNHKNGNHKGGRR